MRFPVTRVQPRKYTDIIRQGGVSFVIFIPTSEPSALHPFPPFFLPTFPSGKLSKRRVQERFAFFEATRTFAIIASSRVIQFFFSPFVTRGRKNRAFSPLLFPRFLSTYKCFSLVFIEKNGSTGEARESFRITTVSIRVE